jgi:cyclic pyranopterin phosphate synthase
MVMKSITTALQLGFNPLKVNCVVMKGLNDNEIVDFVRWTKDEPVRTRVIRDNPGLEVASVSENSSS